MMAVYSVCGSNCFATSPVLKTKRECREWIDARRADLHERGHIFAAQQGAEIITNAEARGRKLYPVHVPGTATDAELSAYYEVLRAKADATEAEHHGSQ